MDEARSAARAVERRPSVAWDLTVRFPVMALSCRDAGGTRAHDVDLSRDPTFFLSLLLGNAGRFDAQRHTWSPTNDDHNFLAEHATDIERALFYLLRGLRTRDALKLEIPEAEWAGSSVARQLGWALAMVPWSPHTRLTLEIDAEKITRAEESGTLVVRVSAPGRIQRIPGEACFEFNPAVPLAGDAPAANYARAMVTRVLETRDLTAALREPSAELPEFRPLEAPKNASKPVAEPIAEPAAIPPARVSPPADVGPPAATAPNVTRALSPALAPVSAADLRAQAKKLLELLDSTEDPRHGGLHELVTALKRAPRTKQTSALTADFAAELVDRHAEGVRRHPYAAALALVALDQRPRTPGGDPRWAKSIARWLKSQAALERPPTPRWWRNLAEGLLPSGASRQSPANTNVLSRLIQTQSRWEHPGHPRSALLSLLEPLVTGYAPAHEAR